MAHNPDRPGLGDLALEPVAFAAVFTGDGHSHCLCRVASPVLRTGLPNRRHPDTARQRIADILFREAGGRGSRPPLQTGFAGIGVLARSPPASAPVLGPLQNLRRPRPPSSLSVAAGPVSHREEPVRRWAFSNDRSRGSGRGSPIPLGPANREASDEPTEGTSPVAGGEAGGLGAMCPPSQPAFQGRHRLSATLGLDRTWHGRSRPSEPSTRSFRGSAATFPTGMAEAQVTRRPVGRRRVSAAVPAGIEGEA